MKFNSRIHRWIEHKFTGVKVTPEDTAGSSSHALESEEEEARNAANFMKPSTIRTGVVQMLTKNAYLHETVGIAAVTSIRGELEETFKKLDKDKDGKISVDEVKEL